MLTNRKLATVGVKWNSEVAYARRQWNNWVYRIMVEINLIREFGGRTWFVTLTYDDASLAQRRFLATYNPDGSSVNSLEQICRKDLSRWLDLLRKKFPFRYIATVEYGKQHSRIHHHVLLHTDSSVSYRSIPLWRFGFYKWKLVDDPSKAAKYVSKYLVKQNRRIKCSSQYGLTIIRYLKSKPRLELLSIQDPKNFLKLLRRYSKLSRTPTVSLIMRSTSLIEHLCEPYKIILVDTNQKPIRLTTTQSPDLCTTN